MNILCPIDFSMSSVNAIYWAASLLTEKGGGNIHLLYCINHSNRSHLFGKIENILKERALVDLELLTKDLNHLYPSLTISQVIYLADPKSFIIKYSTEQKYDWIIMGSTGISEIHELMVGSVAAHITLHTDIPLILVPKTNKYQPIQAVLLGVDNDITLLETSTLPLRELIDPSATTIHAAHVVNDKDIIDKYNLRPTFSIEGYRVENHDIKKDQSISESLNKFGKKIGADLLCMIHHKQDWLQRLLYKSECYQSLFHLDIPLLILPESKK